MEQCACGKVAYTTVEDDDLCKECYQDVVRCYNCNKGSLLAMWVHPRHGYICEERCSDFIDDICVPFEATTRECEICLEPTWLENIHYYIEQDVYLCDDCVDRICAGCDNLIGPSEDVFSVDEESFCAKCYNVAS